MSWHQHVKYFKCFCCRFFYKLRQNICNWTWRRRFWHDVAGRWLERLWAYRYGKRRKTGKMGKYILRRPDPQIIWPIRNENGLWKKADAHYHRSRSGGGSWEFKRKLPERWTISYHDLSFYIEPTGFKHTGLFPEQAVNWKWMIDKIRSASRI